MNNKTKGIGKSIVKLKKRTLSNDNHSLFLECYWTGERSYESLNLFISSEPGRATAEQNKSTLLLADQIRAQRMIDQQSGEYKLQRSKESESFIAYFEANKSQAELLRQLGKLERNLESHQDLHEGKGSEIR